MPTSVERVAVIPARGGSKRIPRKNIRLMAGSPLITWVIEAALESSAFDHVVVSTDDAAIAEVAQNAGATVPGLRPAHLAQDDSSSLDVVLHVLDNYPSCELAALLQPTSPLVQATDINGALAQLQRFSADSVVSVVDAPVTPRTLFELGTGDSTTLRAVCNPDVLETREGGPRWVALNGAIYAFRVKWLRTRRAFVDSATLAYVMPAERSVDVDVEADWLLAEALLRTRLGTA